MNSIFLFILFTLSLKSQTQTEEFITFLFKNKFLMFDVKYGGHSHTAEMDEYWYKDGANLRTKMEMKSMIYDTTKIEQKKLLKKLKFNKNDTLLIYDWDMEESAIPHNLTASKFKFHKNDSSLVFYNSQDISRNGSKLSKLVRNFKVVKYEKNGFILLDKDLTDVKRTYHFKLKKI